MLTYNDHPAIKTGWAEAMNACVIDLQKMGADITLGIRFDDDITLTQVDFENLERR